MTRPWLTLVLLWCCCCLSAPAFGFAALPLSGGSVDEEEVHLVIAAHGERSTLWVEWMVRVTGDRFLVLVPLDSGGTLDLADPAWFAAIEHATAPRVLPPPDVDLEACEATGGVHDTTSLARGERGFPRVVTTLTDAAALAAFLEEASEPADAVSFADFGNPPALVALEYPALSSVPMLVQLRLEAALPAGGWLERLAPLARRTPLPATLTVLAETPVMLDTDDLVYADEIPTNWRGRRGDSDYLDARSRFLEAADDLWVTEVVGATHLFDPYYPDAQAAVPSVVAEFHERLTERGYTCPDWSEWLDLARERDASAPLACGRGELASLDPPACPADPGERALLTCDGIVELGLAFAGARLNEVVLSRHVGRLPTSRSLVAEAAVPNHTAKLYADSMTESACEAGNASSGPSGGAGGTGGEGALGGASGSGGGAAASGGAGGGSGGYWMGIGPASAVGSGTGWGTGGSSSTGGDPGDPDPATPYYPNDEVTLHVNADSCSCGSSSEHACAGDSSSSSNEATCAGDSTTDTETEGETCAGDGSETSGESCSGDGSADVEGDTCSGASDGADTTCASGSGDCAVGRWGLPRPRLSVVTMFLAAGVLPWRRRQRRKR